MRYFKGKGYSEEFVNNFYSVINKIKKENHFIRVINYPDVICNACPHSDNGKCVKRADSEEKVRKKDNKIIEYLGINADQEINAADAINLVNLKLDNVRKICKDCEWKEYCK